MDNTEEENRLGYTRLNITKGVSLSDLRQDAFKNLDTKSLEMLFKLQQFRDPHGHDLVNCTDFQEILNIISKKE